MTESTTRVAIVTGGSRGIGRSIASRLAADGFAVVVGYAGRKDLADEVVGDIEAAGGQAMSAQADVGDEQAVTALFDVAEATYGGVDVVAHSAGTMPLATIADFDLAVFDELVRINIRGTFVVAQQAARRLRDGGAVVTLSSSVTGLSFPRYGGCAATKGAVEALTLILARELRGRDITVNSVAPRPHRDRPVLRRQGPGHDRPARRTAAAGAARHPGGHRGRRRVPHRTAGSLGQRPAHPRQRRNHLSGDFR